MAVPSIQPALKRKTSVAGLPTGGRVVKRRASKACHCCRSRKVRCDVVESGIPCTNCRLDEVECQVSEGKRRKKSMVEQDVPEASPVESCDAHSTCPSHEDINGLPGFSMSALQTETSISAEPQSQVDHHQPHMLYQSQTFRLSHQEKIRRMSMVNQSKKPTLARNPSLPLAIFKSGASQSQISLPDYIAPLPDRLLLEDIEYLQKKGAFQIPSPPVRNELLRCYVQFVHPYLPLLNLEDFLTPIEQNKPTNTISLLLFQAVMFAATAYVDTRFLAAQGFDSRKAARKAAFQRIKLLYDFDYEVDRISLVQSVLLMTYWYESPDDPKDVWHWLGVGISIARTIGLNCDTVRSTLPVEKQRLWKRIWWSCYMRDRLVAIGMRRPTRISEDDYDVGMLQLSDFETKALPPAITRMLGGCSVIRDTSKRELLARMCIAVTICCKHITHVLAAQYSILGHKVGATKETTMRLVPRITAANPVEIENCDRMLEAWFNELPPELRYYTPNTKQKIDRNDGEVIDVHRALLTGIYLTASSALHRPQMMPAVPNLVISPKLKALSQVRVRQGANDITGIYRDLYARDLIKYLPNTAVTILLPAIIVHLLDIKSSDSATRLASTRRFQFCMQALQKLRDVYASADFAFSFLDAAIRRADVPIGDSSEDALTHQPSNPHTSKSTPQAHYSNSLTPPPDTKTINTATVSGKATDYTTITAALAAQQILSTATMTDEERTLFAALTPPSSDRSSTSHSNTSTGGAAITLTDLTAHPDEAFFTPHHGYYEETLDMDTISEEAMENDFDQLINLEGGSCGLMDFTFPSTDADADAVAAHEDDDLDWLDGPFAKVEDEEKEIVPGDVDRTDAEVMDLLRPELETQTVACST